jgi:Tol biopolymer transport system component
MPRPLFSLSPRRAVHSLLLSLFLTVIAAPAAGASPAFYDGISPDGEVAVFTTTEQMVPGDTDQEPDVYVRDYDEGLGEYVTREVSIGPLGGNDTRPAIYDGISADGTAVVFSTDEPMVPADTDQEEDVYLRDIVENRTVLVSRGDGSCSGQGCGNGQGSASFAQGGISEDGDVVFFSSDESLNSDDQDSGGLDLYARDFESEETVLVSAADPSCAGCGKGSEGVSLRGIDRAGDKAFFTTSEKLSAADGDTELDIYERDLGAPATVLVSTANVCPSLNCEPGFGGVSDDGTHVFFETNERLSGLDTDSSQDVYDWTKGAGPTLVSTGPDGGNGPAAALFAGANAAGSAAYFLTDESLVTADTDQEQDVYRHQGTTTTLVSTGPGGRGNDPYLASFKGVYGGLTERVFFSTAEQLTEEDTDQAQDVYERAGGVITLVSTGPGGSGGEFDAVFAGASADGTKVFFGTQEKLVPEDTDSNDDVYMRSATGVVLVSTGQINGNGPFSVVGMNGVSADGARAFFVTQERLTVNDDFAGEQDVYAWSGAGTLLVSVKNSSELALGPPPPVLEATVPASPNASTTPTIVGQADSGALIKVYKTFDCAGEVVAQGTAEELASPGLTVNTPVAAGSTTSFRATAEVEGIVSSCSSPISYTQEDPPPPPPPDEGGGGEPSGGGGTGGTGGTAGSTSGSTGSSGGGKGSGGGTRGGFTYVTPLPRVTFGPASKTRLRRPTFRFLDVTEQPGTHFYCRVDKRRWVQCTSPFKLQKLKLGRHVFSLKAVNAVGTAGASPVKRAFKVVP